jgi:hypothetical protein
MFVAARVEEEVALIPYRCVRFGGNDIHSLGSCACYIRLEEPQP